MSLENIGSVNSLNYFNKYVQVLYHILFLYKYFELFEQFPTNYCFLSLSNAWYSAPSINVLDGRRGDCATRHSAALRAVALARARCTRSPLCLFVWQPGLHYAAHLYHHEQPHFSIPIYRRLRILRHRHLHSPLLAEHDALPFVALLLCWHVACTSSRNILLLFQTKIFFSSFVLYFN